MTLDGVKRRAKRAVKRALALCPPAYGAAHALWARHNDRRRRRRLRRGLPTFQAVERAVQDWEREHPPDGRPVVLMNLSGRTRSISFNGATHVLLGWALRRAGRRVIYHSCRRSLPTCVLGTNAAKPEAAPPCAECAGLGEALFPDRLRQSWGRWPDGYDADLAGWLDQLDGKPLDALRRVSFEGLELGELAWPSLLWALRRGDPSAEPAAAQVLARYVVGAAQLARRFRALVAAEEPEAVVVFNGLFFPEAVVAAVARARGIRTVTYESGFRRGSIHFSHGQATRYDVRVPDDFELGEAENRKLDEHLARRFRGDFTMAGVRFWPEMHGLSPALRRRADRFRHVVPVFTNVIFDTSQAYSNVCFQDMFDWLDATLAIARATPDTLFVVRAHPDESRSGKESREPVGRWLKDRGARSLDNVAFIGPDDYVSSYDLIRRAQCVLIYNSSIGLEAAMLGKPTVSAGLPRYHSADAVIFPATPAAYGEQVTALLADGEPRCADAARDKARRYYYYTLWKACIDLSHFLGTTSQVFELAFDRVDDLLPKNSAEIGILLRGILAGEPFVYP